MELNNFLEILINKIQLSQCLDNKINGNWIEEKGAFPTFIHFNFIGDEKMTEIRNKISVPDYNGFTTTTILQCLLECKKINNAIKINKELINESINSILKCYDFNLNNGSYGFWSQIYNDEFQIYTQYPINYRSLVKSNNENLLFNLFNIDKTTVEFTTFSKYLSKKITSIPPDSDSTSINLIFGELLSSSNFKNEYMESIEKWSNLNNNVIGILNDFCKISYRPFSSNSEQNSIDPRSYYFLRDFITNWDQVKNGELILPMIYLISNNDQIKVFPKIITPSLSNQVDIGTLVNVLYSIICSVKMYGTHILTTDLINVSRSITYLIKYMFDSKLIYSRAMFIFGSYPSIFTNYWLISRIINSLLEFKNTDNQFPPIFNEVFEILNEVCENDITTDLLKRLITENGCYGFYWNDILGNNDTFNGAEKQYNQDKFYTTSIAIDILIDTWSVTNTKTNNRIWKSNTPLQIKEIINNSCNYILNNLLNEPDKHDNVFFSSHSKGRANLITNFPSNVNINVLTGINTNDEQEIKNLHLKNNLISFVSGVIKPEDYNSLLIKYNDNIESSFLLKDPFIYWSSPTLTYSITLLALSKYKSLLNK